MAWFFLTGAVLFEVGATLCLRLATSGSRWWYIGVATGYLLAFTLLVNTLNAGLPLGVAYGVWAATGVALTAILSRFLFDEPLTWVMALGITLIAGGVFMVELGSVH